MTSKSSLHYQCLLDFKKAIEGQLDQTQTRPDALTKMARQRGLLPPGYTSNKITEVVSYCIEGVEKNEFLFSTFLALLEELGLVHLVRKIRVKFQGQQSYVRKPRSPPTSATDFDSGMVSAQSGSLPPFPDKQITPRKSSKAASRPHSSSWSTVEESLQPLHSPITKASALPLQETQEEEDKRGLVFSTVTQSTPTSISVNNQSPVLGVRLPEAVNTDILAENHRLREDNVSLRKEVQDRNCEIQDLKKKIKLSEKQLEDYKTKTAELERKFRQKYEESKEQEKMFSNQKEQIKLQYEKELCELREQILEEKDKTERKELEIKDLEKQVVQKELEKLTLILEYENKNRTIERERDELKLEVAERKSEDEKRKRIAAEQKQEEEEQRRKEVEQKRKEVEKRRKEEEQRCKEEEQRCMKEEQRRMAAERGHRKSLDKIKELEELLKSKDIIK